MSAVDEIINYQRTADEDFYGLLNCTEQATVSFFFLFLKSIQSIHILFIVNIKCVNEAFFSLEIKKNIKPNSTLQLCKFGPICFGFVWSKNFSTEFNQFDFASSFGNLVCMNFLSTLAEVCIACGDHGTALIVAKCNEYST